MTKIVPLAEQVLVTPLTSSQKEVGGLIIPTSQNEDKPEQGEVLALGSEVKLDLKVGDRILFSKYAPQEIKLDDRDYLLIESKSILAKVSK